MRESQRRYQARPEYKQSKREYDQRRYQEFKAWLTEFKQACLDCGRTDLEPYQLHFDHIPERGEKLFNISTAYNRSRSIVLIEIEKCDVVCLPCHVDRSHDRRQLEVAR